jgi:cell division septation protein DedD
MVIKKEFINTLFCIGFLLYLTACSSQKKVQPSLATSNTVLISNTDLQALKQSAKEWKTVEPKVNDLLELEGQLSKLTTRLKAIDESNVAQENTDVTPPATESILKSDQAFFAIQVAAFNSEAKLNTELANLKRKIPAFFNTNLAVNIETKVIKTNTFYRLKLGAYKTSKQATTDCEALKRQKVSCFVTYYTQQKPQPPL